MNLREWTVLHMKHRDAFAKRLQEIRESDIIEFVFPDHTLHGIVLERLSVPSPKGKTLVVTLQTKDNVDFLIGEWKRFAALPNTTMVFAHPGRNEHWSVIPSLHDRVAGENLEQGIRSMASAVDYL